MTIPISVVINTWNNSETLEKTLESVKNVDQIVIVDMHSTDNTSEIASKYTNEIYSHDKIDHVEPARNFAIEKAKHEWVFVLDSDEEIPPFLMEECAKIASTNFNPTHMPTHYFVPRKNLIFGKWVKHAGWWPDNQLRFFKKGSVIWNNEIHSIPNTTGEAHSFPPQEKYALIHHNYTSVSQWITRMDRYTTVQANELIEKGYSYSFIDNINKPFSEFTRRFFAWEGYKDGVIGLNLAILQALSELIVYLKIRESQKESIELSDKEFKQQLQHFLKSSNKELQHWLLQANFTTKIKKILNKLIN